MQGLYQNLNRNATWNARGVPLPVGDVPLTVVVIRPKLALEKFLLGLPYCARLKILKPSIRRTATNRSVILKSREAAASACQKAGQRTRLRPALPRRTCAKSFGGEQPKRTASRFEDSNCYRGAIRIAPSRRITSPLR